MDNEQDRKLPGPPPEPLTGRTSLPKLPISPAPIGYNDLIESSNRHLAILNRIDQERLAMKERKKAERMKTSTWLFPLVVAIATTTIILSVNRDPNPTKWVEIGHKCHVYAEHACTKTDIGSPAVAQCQPYPGSQPTDNNFWYVDIARCSPGTCRNGRCEGK